MAGKVVSVFEKYAHEYDLLTNARQREVYHTKELGSIINKFRPRRALDAGCATGLSAMILAREGIETVGLDRSRRMLEEARKKYSHQDLPLSFRSGCFEKLPKNMHGKFDLVVCLANSISGLSSKVDLRKAMKNFYLVLKPGGNLLVQSLNYLSVTEEKLLPIKATENDGVVWARYARRRGKRYEVHVTRIDLNSNPPDFEPFCHEFDNFSPTEVQDSIKRAGFGKLVCYGDLFCQGKFKKTSRNLVVVGRRPE